MRYVGTTLAKACLNGDTRVEERPAVPLSSEQLVRDGQRAAAAGAGMLHVHARRPDGSQTLDPDARAAALQAIRAAYPGMSVSVDV